MGRLPIYVYGPHCSSSTSSSLQWIPNKHTALTPSAVCMDHTILLLLLLYSISQTNTALPPSAVCMEHTILLLLLYSGSQTNTHHYRHLLSVWTTLFFLFFFTVDPKQTQHYRHLLSVWTTLFFFFFFTADPKQTHIITAIYCLHGAHYSSSSSLQWIPNKHTALPPSAVCMDHTILLLLLYSGSQTNTALPPSAVCMDHTILLLLYSGSQTNTQHYRHLHGPHYSSFSSSLQWIRNKHSITAICCLHGTHYSSSSLQRIPNKHTSLPPSAVCMEHTILLLLYSESQTNTHHYRHLLSAWSTLLALFHCMVRYGTAQFGSVCISTAV